jgi:hypothetical protein
LDTDFTEFMQRITDAFGVVLNHQSISPQGVSPRRRTKEPDRNGEGLQKPGDGFQRLSQKAVVLPSLRTYKAAQRSRLNCAFLVVSGRGEHIQVRQPRATKTGPSAKLQILVQWAASHNGVIILRYKWRDTMPSCITWQLLLQLEEAHMNYLHTWLSQQHRGLQTFRTFQQKLETLSTDEPEQRALCYLLSGIVGKYIEAFDEEPLPVVVADRAYYRLLDLLASLDLRANADRRLTDINRVAACDLWH